MADTTFAELFGGYITFDDIKLKSGKVTSCDINSETRVLTANVDFLEYVHKSVLEKAANDIKGQLMLSKVEIIPHFPKEKFCPAACMDISQILELETCQLNGFLHGAKYSLSGNVLKIELMHGGLETITKVDFNKRFAKYVKDRFLRDIEVEFSGITEKLEIEQEYVHYEPPAPIVAPEPEPQKRRHLKKQNRKTRCYHQKKINLKLNTTVKHHPRMDCPSILIRQRFSSATT